MSKKPRPLIVIDTDPGILATSAVGIVNDTPTDLTINVPVGTNDGDEMFLYIFMRDDASTIQPPAGFTEITALAIKDATQQDREAKVFQRTASSEPSSYDAGYNSITNIEMNAIMVTVPNLNVAIFDVTPTSSHRTGGEDNNNPDTISITTVSSSTIVLDAMWFASQVTVAMGAPVGRTLVESSVSVSAFSSAAVAFHQPGAGATSVEAWQNDVENAFAETLTSVIALKL